MDSDVMPLMYLSEMQDLVDLHEFMDDPKFSEAMELAVKCAANPNISSATAKTVVVQMQAFAFLFKMKAQTYMTIKKGSGGTTDNMKKNVYFAISDQCAALSMALRPMARDSF